MLRALRRCQPSRRVGDLWPSLVGVLLGFRELARCGIGNGGYFVSGRLGLRDRPLWLAMPFWIRAAFLITLARFPKPSEMPDLSCSLLPPPYCGGAEDLPAWFSLLLSARLKELYTCVEMGFILLLAICLLDTRSGDAVVTVSVGLRAPARPEIDWCRGADRAVRYSVSLLSSSPNSPSSELAVSNPANRLLKRWGLLGPVLSSDSGPSSLLPG